MRRQRRTSRELGNHIFSSLRQLGLAGVLRRRGKLREALAAVETGEAFVARSGERIFESERPSDFGSR